MSIPTRTLKCWRHCTVSAGSSDYCSAPLRVLLLLLCGATAAAPAIDPLGQSRPASLVDADTLLQLRALLAANLFSSGCLAAHIQRAGKGSWWLLAVAQQPASLEAELIAVDLQRRCWLWELPLQSTTRRLGAARLRSACPV